MSWWYQKLKLTKLDYSILKDLYLLTDLIETVTRVVFSMLQRILSKLTEMNSSVEIIFIEPNLRGKKWFPNCFCNANIGNICDHLRSLGKGLDILLTNYEKVFLMGGFNEEETNIHFKDLSNLHKKAWSKVPLCLKIQIIQRLF